MKNYILILSICLAFTSCSTPEVLHFDREIGLINDDEVSITFGLEAMKTKWDTHLKQGDDKAQNLTNFRIQLIEDGGRSYYLLLADDRYSQAVSSVELVLDGRKLYERKLAKEGVTVTCAGCDDACTPRRLPNGDGFCTACKSDSGKCNKSSVMKASASVF